MAFGVVKYLAGFLLLLNLCMYVIVGAIAGWALNKALNHTYSTGLGRALPLEFSPVYFPIGNEVTGFMIIFALIAAAVGAASCLSGLHHLRVWTAESLASSTASSMTAWALTLLAMGLVCKEIHIGGRSTKLITLEMFLLFCVEQNSSTSYLFTLNFLEEIIVLTRTPMFPQLQLQLNLRREASLWPFSLRMSIEY